MRYEQQGLLMIVSISLERNPNPPMCRCMVDTSQERSCAEVSCSGRALMSCGEVLCRSIAQKVVAEVLCRGCVQRYCAIGAELQVMSLYSMNVSYWQSPRFSIFHVCMAHVCTVAECLQMHCIASSAVAMRLHMHCIA